MAKNDQNNDKTGENKKECDSDFGFNLLRFYLVVTRLSHGSNNINSITNGGNTNE